MKSEYTGLWLLLSTALILFLLFSFAEAEPAIASWQPKKAPFRESLSGEYLDGGEFADSLLRLNNDELAELEAQARTDSTPQRIFLFGDSMTLNLAYRLAAYAKHNGHEFHAVNWDSSNTKIWAANDTLKNCIRRYKPTQIFIALGANELYLTHPEKRLPQIRNILSTIGDIPFVWIGPPALKTDGGLNELLEKTLPKGTFFRSSGLELKRRKDKIHPTRSASADWIDSVMVWLPKSAHPFIVETPPDTMPPAKNATVLLKALNK